ncbi:uncharacterized protein DNG_09854 [Cephalotrichum gorgonifer]|uniref:His_Phos_1 domain-containing protein n=1 Tax=Cephalotrichum gorgonifer TaxID=2041049 RepID=A0AAE8N6H1_9PEZI|nr:uncharacterized protein DNG_09854 [Cephalotrichum gorgonifer]
MPPTIVLNYTLHDPPLTDEGHGQCTVLRESLKQRLEGETDIAIVVSPLKRTLQTALGSLDWLIERGIPITADAGWQETSAKPCDTGSPVSKLAAEFPSVDFSGVDPVFPDKTSPAGSKYFPTRGAIIARAQSCLRSLYQRPEKWLIVVSHGGFLRMGVSGWWFSNSDYRIFDFDGSPDTELPLKLVQWESTVAGGLGQSTTSPVEIGSGLREDEEEPVSAP